MSKQKESNNYSSILKGTALFGGVQVFNILINLIRGKLVALLLGPEGMGISSLLTSSMNTIQQFTGLGLNMSSIQEISRAYEQNDHNKIAYVVYILRKLLYITATLGSLLSIILCSYLSEWTFGNSDYKWYFVILSIVIFFTTISNGELSILQGIHAVKKLAFTSIIGSLTGLIIGVPLYYYLGYNGIVPAMIALSLTTFTFYRYHTYKMIKVSNIIFQWKTASPLARKMISLGVLLMISSLIGTLVNYIVNAFISRTGSLEDVGLFQAANSITNQYIGLVFTAMAMDFYPRLSAISSDNIKVRELVNQQIEVVILIVFPLAILLIITAPLLIRILLTKDFISLIPVIRWMGLGIVFKAFAFPMGYIAFAKGDKKTFFLLEGIAGNLLMLVTNILFYMWGGVYGLGISFVVLYLSFIFIYSIITKQLYNFSLNVATKKIFIRNFILLISIFIISFFKLNIILYSVMILIFLIVSVLCLHDLNKKSGIFDKIKNKLTNK